MPELRLILSVGRPVAYSAGVAAISMILGIVHNHREIVMRFKSDPVLHLSCGYRADLNKAHVIQRVRDPGLKYRRLDRPQYRRNRDKYRGLEKPLY